MYHVRIGLNRTLQTVLLHMNIALRDVPSSRAVCISIPRIVTG